MKIGPYRVVDLSRTIDPATSKRLCKVHTFYQKSTQDFHSELTVESHLGTHVESPRHFNTHWPSIGELSADAYMGRAVFLNLGCDPRQIITSKALYRADFFGAVRPGDIVVLTSAWHCEPFSNDPSDPRPRLGAEAAHWFCRKQVKCVAFGNGVAIENSVKDSGEFHAAAMAENILLLEVIDHLDELHDNIFFLIYQPMPIVTLDSCCVRAVAIEGIPGFCTPGKEGRPAAGIVNSE